MSYLYFAYASNMDPQTYKRRCPSARSLGAAQLPHHRLAFTRYSRARRGGSADVVGDASSVVWGVLYEVDDACLAAMDKVEGVPAAYRRKAVEVFADNVDVFADNEAATAITYVANRTGEYRPSKAYLEVIVRGAKANGLPDDYVRMLEQIQTL